MTVYGKDRDAPAFRGRHGREMDRDRYHDAPGVDAAGPSRL